MQQPDVKLHHLWNEASIQISGANSVIAITLSTFTSLGQGGENFFKARARYVIFSSSLTKRDRLRRNIVYAFSLLPVQPTSQYSVMCEHNIPSYPHS